MEAAVLKDILNLVYLCQFYGLDDVAEYWHGVVKINDHQQKELQDNSKLFYKIFFRKEKFQFWGGLFKKIQMIVESQLLYILPISF